MREMELKKKLIIWKKCNKKLIIWEKDNEKTNKMRKM